ncbi:MAG: CHASE3 domain-containing protein [Chloroflexi bacterium]|nr:CHASE3 domain-containing protein [Chloroflexota bacterium]
MQRIRDWFSLGSRAIIFGTVFILLVLVGLIVTPIVTSELAIGAHSHVRGVVEPFDKMESQIRELMASTERSFLHYVISGNPSHLSYYEKAGASFRDLLPAGRIQAERLGPAAERHMNEMEQVITRWQQFAEPVIALRKDGRVGEAQAAAASDDSDRLINDIQQHLISLHEYVVAIQDSDRSRLDQFLSAQVILGLMFGILGMLAAVMVAFLARRITRLNEELRTERQQREEFISVVAHDLRTPLTVITGYAGFLMRLLAKRHDSDRERRAVDAIDISTKRLGRMVADLLDASRIESKQLALAKEVIDLPQFVREIVDRAAKLTEGHPLRLETQGTMPPAKADPTRLEQILTNLLSNAAKYSYTETEILVQIESKPGEAVVSVTNQGPGISPEDRPQLFSRFNRTRAAREEKVPGTGLGLYVAKGLVEAHGGRIWVESEVGRNTSFRFTLPVT